MSERGADVLRAVVWEGNLSDRNASWLVADKALRHKTEEARVIFLGSRCAISTEKGAAAASKPSPYQKLFRQGATIVPRNFYFVRAKDLEGAPDPLKTYWIETDPDQAREAKPPYKEVYLSGLVEGRFLYSAVIAKHVLPFIVLSPATVVLPIQNDVHGLRILTADALTKEGYRDAAKRFRKAERIWDEKRGDKAARQNLYQRLDYQRGLTQQDLRLPYLVLYNRSGTNVCAAFLDRADFPAGIVVDFALYWTAVGSAEEASYLAAFLNSTAVNSAIKPFQSRGLLGYRDVTNKVFDVPVPLFDAENPAHARLADLGRDAHAGAQLIAPTLSFSRQLGRQRSEIRKALRKILSEVDGIAATILKGA